jgi:hypothetical protein
MKVFRLKHGPRDTFAILRGVDVPGDTQMIDGFWAKPMASHWRKVRVNRQKESADDAPKPLSDFAQDVSFPLFGERSVAALEDLLAGNGELLPTDCDEAPYWYYNPTTLLDALNETATEFYGSPRQIARYVFDPTKLRSATIFKISQKPKGSRIFVTDLFMARVKQARLTGFDPLLVWSDEDDIVRRFDLFDLPMAKAPA